MIDWPQKMIALQEAVHWAANGRASVVWRDSAEHARVREAGAPWITLALTEISVVGQDQVTYEEPTPGVRAEVITGVRTFTVELRAHSRDQRTAAAAWYVADSLRTRLRRSTYAAERWLIPHEIAIVAMPQVVNLTHEWDGRTEGEAVLELQLSTVVTDRNDANNGTWIDTVLLSSDIGIPALDLTDDPITAP